MVCVRVALAGYGRITILHKLAREIYEKSGAQDFHFHRNMCVFVLRSIPFHVIVYEHETTFNIYFIQIYIVMCAEKKQGDPTKAFRNGTKIQKEHTATK